MCPVAWAKEDYDDGNEDDDVNDNGDRSERETPRPNFTNFDAYFLLQKVPSNMDSGIYVFFWTL